VGFEYDPDKSRTNKAKHGIDFEEAGQLWLDSNRVMFVARFQDEERCGLIGNWAGYLWCAIFTTRNDKIRIISVRKARDYEKELYHEGS
jgi:uncharacterized DUF497 family protein